MKMYCALLLVSIVSLSSALNSATTQAETIYEHNFATGTGADPLNGVGVELGTGAGTLWEAEDSWFADGQVTVGVDGFDNANAFLPFTPSSGMKYTLTATLTASGNTANFMTLGFMDSPTVDTLSTETGGPWMLKRAQGAGLDDEVYSAIDDLTGLELEGVFAGPTELSMVLDTKMAQWTVEFFINGGSVRGPVDVSPTITHVGVTRYVNPVTGSVDSFSLTAVPEPSSLLMIGALLLGLGLGRIK